MDPAWEWHVGDPVGLGNDIGAPEVPYMDYAKKHKTEKEIEEYTKENEIANLKSKSRQLSKMAWELKEEKRYGEALIFINRALEYCDTIADNHNKKAIILERLNRYTDALISYDDAIELDPKTETYRHNKAVCLIDYCNILKDEGDNERGIEKINDSLAIFKELSDREYEDEAWNLKGIFLERFNDIPEAFKCYKKAIELANEDTEMKTTYKENRDRLLEFIDASDVTCPECGNKVKITDNFCLKCGKHFDMEIELIEKNEPRSNYKLTRTRAEHDNLSETIIEFDED